MPRPRLAASYPDVFASAACVGSSSWPWPDTATDRPELWDAAVELCEQCPARVACLDYALQLQCPSGVWGGVRLVGTAHRASVERERLRDVLASVS